MPNLALQQGTTGSGGEKLIWTYYDTASLLSTTLTHHLFALGVSSGRAKNLTNIPIGGQMPQAQRLTVNALKIMYAAAEVRTEAEIDKIYQVLQNTVLDFSFPGHDKQLEVLLQEALGVASLIMPHAAAATESGARVIQARYHGIFPLSIPIVIAATMPFTCDLTLYVASDAGLDGDRIRVGLAGVLERGI